ncbi:glycan-binding surface protein [Labilibaculum euxinus]
MKKIMFNRIHFAMLVCFVILGIQLTSCEKEEDNSPVITGIRNYAPAPNDTILDVLVPGQYVVLEGSNLQNASLITFDGIPATIDNGILAGNYAVVKVPDVIPFPLVAEVDVNKVRFVNTNGETSFDFPILAGPPAITGVSNELPTPGTVVAISGTNLFQIESFSFGGTNIADFQISEDGTFITFTAPELTQSGPVKVVTRSGVDSTIFAVNDFETGMLCNFDDINTFSWGAEIKNDSQEFPGNQGNFAVLNSDILAPWSGDWWSGGRSINLNGTQLVPVEDLDLPVDNFALKFEFNVPGDWIGTQLYVIKDYSFEADPSYQMLWEPWLVANGAQTFSATTAGQWVTVTLPLTMFKVADSDGLPGKGDSVASLVDLLGDAGSGGITIYTANKTEVATETGFRGAFDNIRIIRIK